MTEQSRNDCVSPTYKVVHVACSWAVAQGGEFLSEGYLGRTGHLSERSGG